MRLRAERFIGCLPPAVIGNGPAVQSNYLLKVFAKIVASTKAYCPLL